MTETSATLTLHYLSLLWCFYFPKKMIRKYISVSLVFHCLIVFFIVLTPKKNILLITELILRIILSDLSKTTWLMLKDSR